MKRIIFLLCFFSFQLLGAQEVAERVSVSFENVQLRQALVELENISGYKFYYLDNWMEDKVISASFTNIPIPEILEKIFSETLLNFYLLDNKRIVLTRGNIIYDDLPQGFFPAKETEATVRDEEQEYNPVFYKDQTGGQQTIETIFIGRERRTARLQRLTLTGTITDRESGDPISNLAVLVRDRGIGTVTNERGFYSLQLPPGEHIIETKSLGSENLMKRVVIYNDGQLNFRLSEDYETLGEVLITGDRDRNVNSAVAGAENINVREIRNIPLVLGERDIMKVAATLPGISTAGEGAAGFNVRGGQADQNLIILDDAVMYNPAHFFGIFSAINPFTTGDVNIYKGSIPAEFGGRLSGVFDIRTKDANISEFSGEGSLGPVTSNLVLEVPIVKERSGILVGGRSTYSNWILRSLDEESLKNSTANFYDVIVKYNHQLNEKTGIKATGYYSSDLFSITSDSLYGYTNRLLSINLNHSFNEKHRGNFIFSNSDYKFNIDYDNEFNNNFKTGYNINETELKLNMHLLPHINHKVGYGISTKLYSVMPGSIEPTGNSIIEEFSLPRDKGLESAIYLSDSYTVNNDLLIDAGLRFSVFSALGEGFQNIYEAGVPKNETSLVETRNYGNNEVIKTYGGPELRLSARYFLMPELSLKISYNNAIQYIHMLSNNTTVSPTATYQLSNLNIDPQRGRQYSLGLYKNIDQNTYELSLEGYYKTSTDILDYKIGAPLFLNENIETAVLTGVGRSYGGEFLLKKTTGRLNGWLGYTYSRSMIKIDGQHPEERVNNGEYFPSNFDKPHDLSLVANFKITQRYSFSSNFVYQTGRPVTFPTGKYMFNGAEYVVYSDRNMIRIPDYYRLDLSFNIEGDHRIKKLAHSFWNISVYNVLGRNNPYSVFFVTTDGEVKAFQSSIFSVPVPTITYNFRF
ncbi:MAG TPA: carboxypeptidase-like regulatory domain-containing protein [Gillisia sp.]|nr:carboxypeptidase-like regulatory domain-containing protein [Gillisia sp.]